MQTDGHEELVGVVSGQQRHEDILQQKTHQEILTIIHRVSRFSENCFFIGRCLKVKVLNAETMIVMMMVMMVTHPVICCGDHQRVWHQDGGFGLLDVCDRHHWDGDLSHENI